MKKVKNETEATFSHVYETLASKFCHFSHLSSEMKVNHAFKAKKEAFRDKVPKREQNDHNFLYLAFVFSVEIKPFVSLFEPETWRKPMLVGTAC